MEHIQAILARLYNLVFPPLTPERASDLREIRPFFLMSIGALAFLYAVSIYFQPHLRQPLNLAVFTILMLIHGYLHLQTPRYTNFDRRDMVFILVQVGLAFILCLVGANLALPYGLYMGLIGELAGFYGITPLGIFSIVFSLAASAASFALVDTWQHLGQWALTALPMTLFVVLFVVIIRRQFEARDQAQTLLHDLESAHKQLAEYAEQVQELTLVAERQRMARELHDTLSQGLAGLILQLEAASAHLESQRTAKAQDVLANAMTQARETLSDARKAIGDLRQTPEPLDLWNAIHQEADDFANTTGVIPDMDVAPSSNHLSENLKTIALRMVSECLNNAARHAEARQVWVRLAPSGNVVYVEVGDDGRGFDLPQALNLPGHYGLLGMRERAALAGGRLEISSTPGLGTVVRMEMPIESRVASFDSRVTSGE